LVLGFLMLYVSRTVSSYSSNAPWIPRIFMSGGKSCGGSTRKDMGLEGSRHTRSCGPSCSDCAETSFWILQNARRVNLLDAAV